MQRTQRGRDRKGNKNGYVAAASLLRCYRRKKGFACHAKILKYARYLNFSFCNFMYINAC